MNKITLDQDKIIKPNYSEGFESNVAIYQYDNGEQLLLKHFKKDMGTSKTLNYLYGDEKPKTIEEIKENKEKKIKLLSELNDERIAKIRDVVYENDELIGYTMEEIKGKQYDDLGLTKHERIEYLSQIRDTMLRLNEKGVYIGDFNQRNFLIDENKKVYNIDIDNYRINDLDFDTKTKYMKEFIRYCDKKELIDRFCFNIFAISMLGGYALGYFTIEDVTLPWSLRNKNNKEIIEEMYRLGEDYTGKILTYEKKKKN